MIFGQTYLKLQAKITIFLYIQTSRWRCAKTQHVGSGLAWDDMYELWSEYDKALQRYSHESKLGALR